MADTDIGAQLATAYPTTPQQQGSAGTSTASEVPMGATKANPFGIERGSLQKISKSDEAIEKATGEQGENAVNRAVIESDRADAAAPEMQRQQDELKTLVDMHHAEYQKELERAKPLFEQADKFQFHQYWSDPHKANAALAAISSALLGFGTGQYHNIAMELAEKDHEHQVHELNGIIDRARAAGANLKELHQIHQDAEQALSVMHLGRMKALMAQYDRMAAGAGIPEAQAQAEMGKAIAQRRAADAWLKIDQTYRKKAANTVMERTKAPPQQLPGL